jgi:hypothetical protein
VLRGSVVVVNNPEVAIVVWALRSVLLKERPQLDVERVPLLLLAFVESVRCKLTFRFRRAASCASPGTGG